MPKQFRRKLNDKSKKLLMVGYQGDLSNYRLYEPETKRVIMSRDVVFDEFHDDQTSRADSLELRVLRLSKSEREKKVVEVSEDEEESDGEDGETNEPGQDEIKENKQLEVNTPRQLRDRGRLRAPQRYGDEVNFAACKTLETFREAVEGPDSTK